MTISLRRAGGLEINFEARALLVAGFTGRDGDAVAAHIEELGRIGVPPPAQTPAIYPLPVSLLTAERLVAVSSRKTSGEVEPVLFCSNGAWYVGVGSDHTARDLELYDIARAKAACPKVIGTEVIDYSLAVESWATLTLRTRAGSDSELYQDGSAGELLPIPTLLEHVSRQGYELADGTVVFLGTVPLRSEEFVYAAHWSVELAVPDGPTLKCSYDVEVAS